MAAPAASLARPPPYPQDCSKTNHTVTPDWFSECAASPGGCFSIRAPPETMYNVGNSTYSTREGFGVKWCIDHLQGFVYSKVMDTEGTMFFEVDDILKSPPPSCRFLVGREMETSKVEYHVRIYREDSLTCLIEELGSPSEGVRLFDLRVL